LLFLPAWSFTYWEAWVFFVVFDVSANAIGLYLALKDPALLKQDLPGYTEYMQKVRFRRLPYLW